MITDALALKEELEAVANKYDKGCKVVIATREPNGNAQAAKKVTFGIIVKPDNEELVNALVRYGIDSENEVEFIGSYVNLQSEIIVDVLQVSATIYYKG